MVYLILGDGFEEIEAVTPLDILRRAGIDVLSVGLSGKTATGSHGIVVTADREIGEVSADDAEMLILPGGGKGVESIRRNKKCVELIKAFGESGKLVAAICAAPSVLASMGFLKGLHAVVYPGMEDKLEQAGALVPRDERVMQDRNVITAQAAGSAVDFALKLVCVLRGWYEAEKVRREIYYQGHDRSLT